jgi:hypothetical protein
MNVKFTGGWRNEYRTLLQEMGYDGFPAGRHIVVTKDGHRIGWLPITRTLDLEVDVPKLQSEYDRIEKEKRAVSKYNVPDGHHLVGSRHRGKILTASLLAISMGGPTFRP